MSKLKKDREDDIGDETDRRLDYYGQAPGASAVQNQENYSQKGSFSRLEDRGQSSFFRPAFTERNKSLSHVH